MDQFIQLIESLSKEEIQAFKLFALRKNNRSDRKDIQLFDYAKKNGICYNEDFIANQLYPDQSKNPYYRLKNRLTETLNKAMVVHHINRSDYQSVLGYLSLSETLFEKNEFELALINLKKAEKICCKAELFELFDIVLSEQIKLSEHLLSLNVEELVEQRRNNQQAIIQLRQLDDVLAVLNQQLKKTQNYGNRNDQLFDQLQKIIKESGTGTSKKYDAKLFKGVTQMLLKANDFENLYAYAIASYDDFSSKGYFQTPSELELQVLTYELNSSFKTGRLKEAIDHSKQLKGAFEKAEKSLRSRYEIYYYNGLVNIYNKIDKQKSIEVLHALEQSPLIKSHPFYEIFVHINLALNYYDLGNFKKAIRSFNSLYLSDEYSKASESLKFKWAIGELIIRFKIGDMDRLKNVCAPSKINFHLNYP